MKLLKTKLPAFIAMLSLAWLCRCTYTQSYTPELTDKQQSIADTINSEYHFEAINVTGKKTSGTNGKHNILLIQFINGVNIPIGDTAEKELAKQLGKQIINAIQDPKQFDGFTIGFDTRKVDGAMTTNKFINFDFSPAEIIGNK